MIEMDLQQARYEASLAERRYAACDPENRLIAAQLERNWEATLRRVETCEARLSEVQRMEPVDAIPDFTGLAQDLEAGWNAPGVDMRCRQQLLRALIKDIVADVDDDARDVILTIHWHVRPMRSPVGDGTRSVSTVAARARTRSRMDSCPSSGTHTAVSSPARVQPRCARARATGSGDKGRTRSAQPHSRNARNQSGWRSGL